MRWWWGLDKLLTYPYPLKVKGRPPRYQRMATQFRISGREENEGAIDILNTVENHNWYLKKRS